MATRPAGVSTPTSRSSTTRRSLDKSLYKPVGYKCRQCSFTSKKKGFDGRQSLRAHIKKHKRESRAFWRPFVKQSVVVLIIAGLGVAGWMDIYPASKMPFALPTLKLTQNVVDWGTFGVGIGALTVGFVVMLMALRFISDDLGNRGLARTLWFISIIGSFAGLWIVMGLWGLATPSVSWVFQMPVWITMALTTVLFGLSGSMRLLVRRRKVSTNSFLTLLTAKDGTA